MALFHYPNMLHTRVLSPGPFSRYQSYKSYLRTEFDATCVYCRMPDRLADINYYAVDHYRPKKKFPALINEYLNLFYSCGTCNTRKSQFWPDKKQLVAGVFIPNPCEYRMNDHMRYSADGSVIARSTAGKWTIDLMRLNEPLRIKKRGFYVSAKKRLLIEKLDLLKLLNELKEKQEANLDSASTISISDIKKIEDELAGVEEDLKFIGD